MMLFTLLPDAALHASDRKTLFDSNWKFHLGIVANAEQPEYNDSHWRVLDLPHDWSVEPLSFQKQGITTGPFSRMSEGDIDTGQTVGGEGWYRKELTLAGSDADKRIVLYFEGVYNQSELWINGKKANYNVYGYTSYRVDITPYLNAPGTPNVIAMKVVNAGRNSRWYAGSGIFRHVWLIKTNKLYLDKWDTFVNASELQKKEAVIQFSTIVHNEGLQNQSGKIGIKIYSPAGNEVFSTSQDVILSEGTPVVTSFSLKKPELWSVDTPVLYTAEVSLSSDGKEYDKISVPFGIRTLSFSAEKGFLLNGKSMKLKGGCVHHFSFATRPIPTHQLIGPAPTVHHFFLAFGNRGMDCHSNGTLAPQHITIIRLRLLVATKVNITAPTIIPRPTHKLRIMLALFQI